MKYILFILIIIVCCIIILADSFYLSKTNEPLTTINENTPMTNSYDTIFHDSIEDIQEQSNAYIPAIQKINVTDNSGNSIKIEIPKILANSTYYNPGTYKYSASSYVPSYEDSIYLSKSIGVVPRLEGDYYLPSSNYDLNSIETPYSTSDSLISPEWTNNNITAEPSDNVNYAPTDNKNAQLQVTYAMAKTDEELDYEQRLADLLGIQADIRSYATNAPMNIQQKLTSSNISSNVSNTPTTTIIKATSAPLPKIQQVNKKDFYKLPTGAPVSSNYLLGVSDQ